MADDLDFKHSVNQIPQAASLPNPIQRTERIETHDIPDMQGAISNYANSTNWMSAIGANVAAKSSNAIAGKLGTELGKNPKGNIGIPLTDFDTVMQNSYKTQSQSTLSIQANKLIVDSNLEMAKAPRITPDLLQKTNRSIALGLNNIFSHAPEEVKTGLENQYANQQVQYMAQLSERMIHEQKEDQRNTTALATKINTEQAYSFAMNGNYEAAEKAIDDVKKANDADVAARLITPEMAKANVDSARQSYLSGKYINQYEVAKSEGKGEQYLKSLADKKPKDISDEDFKTVSRSILSHVAEQQSLSNQDEQLRLAQFNTHVAQDINSITPSTMSELKQNVTPIEYEKAQLTYIRAMKAQQTKQGEISLTVGMWSDPEGFARIPEKQINQGFDVMVDRLTKYHGPVPTLSRQDAEVEIAASAAGKIPVFVDGLKNKLNSPNPAFLDEAVTQMNELYKRNASHALLGLSDQDKAIYTQYKSLRDAMPPLDAAQVVIQNANQDNDTQTMNKAKWSAFVKKSTAGTFSTTAPTDWALGQVGMNKKDFMNPGSANLYGQMILDKYSSFYQMMNGDKENALKITKQSVEENFGYTTVNGDSFKTLHPIEKVLGYGDDHSVTPFIQNDVMDVLNRHFIPMKQLFDSKNAKEYWEVIKPKDPHKILFATKYSPIQVKKYTRDGNKVTSDLYNVVLIGNSFNWDISLQTEAGLRPLPQIAPYLGLATYTPNKKAIDSAYRKAHSHE